VLVSFLEHAIHRQLMHRRSLPASLYRRFAFLDRYQRAHAVLHHTTYYHRFDHEPDPVGREVDVTLGPWTALRLYLAVSPLVLCLACIDVIGAVVFTGVALVHMRLWGILHHEMHVPQSPFLQRLRAFRYLARHHFLHHRYPSRNYNVVIPIADAVLGTLARARPADVREMLRLGHLAPRDARTLARLELRPQRAELPARPVRLK
jgi:hypothetical protein